MLHQIRKATTLLAAIAALVAGPAVAELADVGKSPWEIGRAHV
jgi:hypothetical protein